MPTFSRGNFCINLGFVQLGGELGEEDRQCAWEFYVELTSRVAVCGKLRADGSQAFTGEVLDESLESLYHFFQASREIIKRYPVGTIAPGENRHLGYFIARLLETAVRPFLERWQSPYRTWWRSARPADLPPLAAQKSFPHAEAMRRDWEGLRTFCREAAAEIRDTYRFVDLLEVVPAHVRADWIEESEALEP